MSQAASAPPERPEGGAGASLGEDQAPPPGEASPERSLGFVEGKLSWALGALVAAFLAASISGSDALGLLLDEGPLDRITIAGTELQGGAVLHVNYVYDQTNQPARIVGRTSLGGELVSCALYFLLGVGAAFVLARRSRALLRPRGGALLPQAFATLATLVLAGGALFAVLGARFFPDAATGALLSFQRPLLTLFPTALLFSLRFVLVGPIAEELLWRGVVYPGLRERLSPVPAAVACALGFALWHLAVGWRLLPALLLHYVFSIAACWLTERTRSLLAATVLHVVGNAGALGLYALLTYCPNEVLYVLGLP